MTTVAIYALVDPKDDLARYVGQSRDAMARYFAHIRAAFTFGKDRWAKDQWIYELVEGRREMPVLEILDFTEDWRPVELSWIERLRGEGHPLLNRVNWAWSQTVEGREFHRRKMTGTKMGPETRAKMSASAKAAWAEGGVRRA